MKAGTAYCGDSQGCSHSHSHALCHVPLSHPPSPPLAASMRSPRKEEQRPTWALYTRAAGAPRWTQLCWRRLPGRPSQSTPPNTAAGRRNAASRRTLRARRIRRGLRPRPDGRSRPRWSPAARLERGPAPAADRMPSACAAFALCHVAPPRGSRGATDWPREPMRGRRSRDPKQGHVVCALPTGMQPASHS